MTNDVKNIPELRFPEFSSEWIEKRLGDIGEFKNGLNKDKTEFGFGVPFVNLNDVFSNIPIVKENLSLVNANDKEIKDYNLVQGDTLFIRSSVKPSGVGLTKVIINNDFINTVYSGFLIRYRNFEKYNIDNNFKKYIFNSKSVRKQVIRQSTSSANTNINQEELKLIKINMPPTVEQQKIGEFFSKLDQQIELEKQKLSLLEEQKKGYMQKIFSQELRFKDGSGNEYPEWEDVKIQNIANIKKGEQIKKENIDNNGKYYHLNGGTTASSRTNLFNTNPFTISISEGGNSCGFIKMNKEYFFSGGHNYTLLDLSVSNFYLYSYLKYHEKKIMSLRVGSGLPNIQKKDISNYLIKIPRKEEQDKIG
ncbi:restriction endonuclease subunit S, partial [Staphylococcus haemolyticus]|uniref:restriction endonuclease subunit S n=1 Tax=Staphylococcus haemolyticus TaxID=1283 RepID=UPI0030D3C13B